MCLDCLISQHGIPDSGIGYKRIFVADNGKFWFSMYNHPRKFDTWYDADKGTLPFTVRCGEYPVGFHFYRSREAGRSFNPLYALATIEYEGLRCVGLEADKTVLVAGKIRILRDSLTSKEGREIETIEIPRPVDAASGIWYFSGRRIICNEFAPVKAIQDIHTGEVMF